MFSILLIFLLSAALLALLFWVGGVFLQGYFYTEPSTSLWWQAPTAGTCMATFITVWCLCNAMSAQATTLDITYDTIFRFTPRVEMFPEPAKEMWAVPKKGAPVLYKRERIADRLASGRYQYVRDTVKKEPWTLNVEAILLEYKGEKLRFVPAKMSEAEVYRRFVSDKGDWEMREYDNGPSGRPGTFRTGRFAANLLFNFAHLVLWFVCLWLLLRFNIGHALVMTFALWLTASLVLLPILFTIAAGVAQQRAATGPRTAAVHMPHSIMDCHAAG